ncbi:MAG: hypothetical protein HXY22_09610 [Alphaproteobacteria bacterium]|nr:hypothetical protein [Alphaproteobacteria bacterium]
MPASPHALGAERAALDPAIEGIDWIEAAPGADCATTPSSLRFYTAEDGTPYQRDVIDRFVSHHPLTSVQFEGTDILVSDDDVVLSVWQYRMLAPGRMRLWRWSETEAAAVGGAVTLYVDEGRRLINDEGEAIADPPATPELIACPKAGKAFAPPGQAE